MFNKNFLLFIGLWAFSGIVVAVPVNCVQGTVSGVLICVTQEATSSVSLVAAGLVTISAVMMGVYLIMSSMNK